MKQTEGTWDATIRKIIWGVPTAAVVIGLLILSFAHLQPSYTGMVTDVGKTAYTPSRTMVRGHSSAYYEANLKVEYTSRQGTLETATVQFGSTNPNAIPKVGDQIRICRGLSGMVTHPNRDLIGVGGGAAGTGGLFLAFLLLTMWRDKRCRLTRVESN